MSWKSRTAVGIVTATVLTGAGVATMANALAAATPAPAVSVDTPATPAPVSTALAAEELRTEQLAHDVDGLLAEIRVLEQAVAAGSGAPVPTPSPSLRPGRDGSTSRPTAGPTTESPTASTSGGLVSSGDRSETAEPAEPSDG